MPRFTVTGLLVLTFVIAWCSTLWRIHPLVAALPLVPIGLLFLVLLVATIGRLISGVSDRGKPVWRRDVSGVEEQ